MELLWPAALFMRYLWVVSCRFWVGGRAVEVHVSQSSVLRGKRLLGSCRCSKSEAKMPSTKQRLTVYLTPLEVYSNWPCLRAATGYIEMDVW